MLTTPTVRPKRFKPRRTHAAERTTGTRKGAGSRRNRRTGYAARAEQYRAFGRRIRRELIAGYLLELERAMIYGSQQGPVISYEADILAKLATLPDATLELRGFLS